MKKNIKISFLKKRTIVFGMIVLFLIVLVFSQQFKPVPFWNIFPIKFYCEVNKLFNIQSAKCESGLYNSEKINYNDTFLI